MACNMHSTGKMAENAIFILMGWSFLFSFVKAPNPWTPRPVCTGTVSREEAEYCCRDYKGLPMLRTMSEVDSLLHRMREDDKKVVWLGNKQKLMEMWQWTDGKNFSLFNTSNEDKLCALYNMEKNIIESAACDVRSKSVGSICQFKDPAQKDEWEFSHIGREYKGIFYLHFCDPHNWHEARRYCLSEKYTLTTDISSKEVMDFLSDGSWVCNKFWVGLRRKDWIDQQNKPVDFLYNHWKFDEKSVSGPCCIFKRTEANWEFTPVPCDGTASYLCQEKITTSSRTPLTEQPPWNDTSSVIVIIVVVLGVLTVLAVLAVCLFLIRKRSRRLLNHRMRYEFQNGQPVTIPLMPTDNIPRLPKANFHRLRRMIRSAIIGRFGDIEIWSWCDEVISIKMDEIYTDLSWAKVRRRPAELENTPLEHYTDMFDKVGRDLVKQHIFVQGQPGSGKTTMAKKLLIDWARFQMAGAIDKWIRISKHVRLRLGQFDLIIPIFMRDVGNNEKVEDVICRQIGLPQETAEALSQVFLDPKRQVLLILEGYDEYREATSAYLTRLAHRESLSNLHLLITSRMSPQIHYRHDGKLITSHLILHGFSEKGVTTYINKFFNDEEQEKTLLTRIEATPGAHDLSKFPAILLIICILWRDTKKLANNITDFYKHFVVYICCRLEKRTHGLNADLDEDHILTKYQDDLLKIANIAKDGLMTDMLRLAFPFDTAKEELKGTAWDLGFLKVEHNTIIDKTVTFSHKTVQEYFTAYFIVHCTPNARLELLTYLSESPDALREANMIVKFLKGMKSEILTEFIHRIMEGNESDRAKTKTAVQMAYLANVRDNDIELPEVICMELNDRYTPEILNRYCSMDARKVKTVNLWTKELSGVDLIGKLEAENLNLLKIYYTGEEMQKPIYTKPTLSAGLRPTTIHVHDFLSLDYEDMYIFSSVIGEGSTIQIVNENSRVEMKLNCAPHIHFNCTSELRFENCHLGASTICGWVAVLERHPDLVTIETHIYEEESVIFSSLSNTLKWFPLRVSVKIQQHVDVDMEGGPSIHMDLAVQNKFVDKLFLCGGLHADLTVQEQEISMMLQSLTLCDLASTEAQYEHLAQDLRETASLTELNVHENRDINFITPLVKEIGNLKQLKILNFTGSLSSEAACVELGKTLHNLTHLTEFRMFRCETKNAVSHLLGALPTLTCLEKLDLSGNLTDPRGASVHDLRGIGVGNTVHADTYVKLSEWLLESNGLREIRLCESDASEGVGAILCGLQYTKRLESLDLSGNTVESEVFVQLGKQLRQHKFLRAIRVFDCDTINAVSHVVENLNYVPSLRVLDISGVKAKKAKRGVFRELLTTGNVVDKHVYKSLGGQLQHLSQLSELRVCKSEHVDSLRPVIKELHKTPRLQTLDLLGNVVSSGVLKELSLQLRRLGDLEELRLSYCRESNAVTEIVQIVHHLPKLVILDIRGTKAKAKEKGIKILDINTIYSDTYELLRDQLQSVPRLIELRLCRCHKSHYGQGAAVLDGLQFTPGLQVLEIGRRSLDATGVMKLGQAFNNLPLLRQLLLADIDIYDMENVHKETRSMNAQMHEAWITCIKGMFTMSLLQVVVLSYNNVGNESVRAVTNLLPSLPHLDALYMAGCGLTDNEAVLEMLDAFAKCPAMRGISFGENHLTDEMLRMTVMERQMSRLYWLALHQNKLSDSARSKIRALKTNLPDLEIRV